MKPSGTPMELTDFSTGWDNAHSVQLTADDIPLIDEVGIMVPSVSGKTVDITRLCWYGLTFGQ